MKYMVIVGRKRERFGAYVPDLPGCAGEGATKEEALHSVKKSIEENVQAMSQAGYAVPEQSVTIEYVELRNPIY